jgi:hypothetical protein
MQEARKLVELAKTLKAQAKEDFKIAVAAGVIAPLTDPTAKSVLKRFDEYKLMGQGVSDKVGKAIEKARSLSTEFGLVLAKDLAEKMTIVFSCLHKAVNDIASSSPDPSSDNQSTSPSPASDETLSVSEQPTTIIDSASPAPCPATPLSFDAALESLKVAAGQYVTQLADIVDQSFHLIESEVTEVTHAWSDLISGDLDKLAEIESVAESFMENVIGWFDSKTTAHLTMTLKGYKLPEDKVGKKLSEYSLLGKVLVGALQNGAAALPFGGHVIAAALGGFYAHAMQVRLTFSYFSSHTSHTLQ